VDPGFKWSWDKNFAKTRQMAIEIISEIEDKSFIVSDEAGDIAYRGDTIKARQKNLIKLMVKSGTKGLLTIIVTSDYFLLDPKLLNMCLFLVAVPYRYEFESAFAFIYGRNPNPFIYDKFGVERIKSMFLRKKSPAKSQVPTMKKMPILKKGKKIEIPYPHELFKFMKSIPTFLTMVRFGRVSQVFEESYKKHVKNKYQLLSHMEDADEFVNIIEFKKLESKYRHLIYNLKVSQGLSVAQIERLHIDPATGNYLSTRESINRILASVSMVVGKLSTPEDPDRPSNG
jgi:hypothetical protein